MAADSAVTIAGGRKIYNSSNKLFMLSKYHPVGIMVYDSADFMDVSWETIIKVYRNELGTTFFNTVEEYGKNFLEFLSTTDIFGFKDLGKTSLTGMIYETLFWIYEQVTEGFENDPSEIEFTNQYLNKFLDSLLIEVKSLKKDDGSLEDFDTCVKNFNIELPQIYQEAFFDAKLFLDDEIQQKMILVATQILKKGNFVSSGSGIVIAGFGQKEIFPAMASWNLYGIIQEGRLITAQDQVRRIDRDRSVCIIPFAQGEMVERFIDGIDSDFFENLVLNFQKMLDQMQSAGAIEQRYIDKLSDLQDYFTNTIIQQKREFSDPVLEAVSSLPNSELAAMAESLVNLTSFKRRVTFQEESVGGPIDVAVISKGDGFIWIKRKHYFQPELNHHFFNNYYRDVRKDETHDQ